MAGIWDFYYVVRLLGMVSLHCMSNILRPRLFSWNFVKEQHSFKAYINNISLIVFGSFLKYWWRNSILTLNNGSFTFFLLIRYIAENVRVVNQGSFLYVKKIFELPLLNRDLSGALSIINLFWKIVFLERNPLHCQFRGLLS